MSAQTHYLHLPPGGITPPLPSFRPFLAVVIAEAPITPDWQATVSDWLVQAGCLYMLAWGVGCSSWDDAVDFANLERFDFADIPEAHFVMTTWHERDTLQEVFTFAKGSARHPRAELGHALLLHIAAAPSEQELLRLYQQA